jgi:hypothetical protein
MVEIFGIFCTNEIGSSFSDFAKIEKKAKPDHIFATRRPLVEKMESLCEKKNYQLRKFNKFKIMRAYLEK